MLTRLVTGYLDIRGQPPQLTEDVPQTKDLMVGARPAAAEAVILITSASEKVRPC
jgi:hypothetical protein